MNWVREKFAERRAKWVAARNKRTATPSAATTTGSKEENAETERLRGETSTSRTPINGFAVVAVTVNNGLSNEVENVDGGNVRQQLQITNDHGVRDRIAASTNATTSVHGCSLPNLRGQQHNKVASAATPQTKRISKLKSRRCSSNSSAFTTTSSDDTLDGGLRTKERIKVRIICPNARLLAFQTDVNKRLTELKNEILLELADDPASMPHFALDTRTLGSRYRLFRAEYQGTELNETLPIAQLHLADNDTLVLVPRRSYLQTMTTITRETQGPRESDIEQATCNITPSTSDMPLVDINEIFQQSNLQFDVRKVLISLAQASAAVIGAGPYATRLIAMLKQKLINKRKYQNDTLQCLIDMGFKKEKAEYALRLQNGAYSAALEYLIQHQSDETPVEEPIGIQKSQSIISPSRILTNDSVIENSEALLEIVRIYSHRDIPPTKETVEALVEMGFEETEVLHALKKTCNNKAAACEWLCGNRSGSLIELRDGLAQDSPILKAILEMPQVQMNLSNPKILLAFLSILENENSIRVWGGDNDTTSVITHILQKYHEEKHVLGINQFYSNRS